MLVCRNLVKASGVLGGVVKVIDFKPLAPQHCWFEFLKGVWILLCEEAIQLVY
jgi:hypothetical protein